MDATLAERELSKQKAREAELKPCPFCGALPIWDEESGFYMFFCNNPECHMNVETDLCESLEEARKYWNSRVA